MTDRPDDAGHGGPALDPADLQALTQGHGAVRVPKVAISVVGPDAGDYLHGQLSQDIRALGVGGTRLSFLLEPTGRLVALGRVSRTDEEAYLFDTEPEVAEDALARLRRFRLRAKLDLEARDLPVVAVRGARRGLEPAEVDGATVLPSAWPQLPGWDLLPDSAERAEPGGLDVGGARWCGMDAYEAVRIAAGVPRARDFDERVIPAETGVLEAAVSFTKGCYTGQELVGRMDARGNNAPRRLRVVHGEGEMPSEGSEVLTGDDKRVGALTSLAPTGDGQSWVGLGLLARAAAEADELRVEGGLVSLSPLQD